LLGERRLRLPDDDCQRTDSLGVQHVLAMKRGLRGAILTAVAVFALAAPVAAGADQDNDNDLARDLYEQGEIRSLADILHILSRQTPGQVVAVDLVQAGGKWVYRLQVVTADGRRLFVDVDAGATTVSGGGESDH